MAQKMRRQIRCRNSFHCSLLGNTQAFKRIEGVATTLLGEGNGNFAIVTLGCKENAKPLSLLLVFDYLKDCQAVVEGVEAEFLVFCGHFFVPYV